MNEITKSRASGRRVNLTVSMDDERYRRIKDYKSRHEVSLSAMAREWMREDLYRANGAVSE